MDARAVVVAVLSAPTEYIIVGRGALLSSVLILVFLTTIASLLAGCSSLSRLLRGV